MNPGTTGVPTALRRNRLYAALALVLAAVLMSAGVLALPARGQQAPLSFSTVRDVPLPGDTSRFDYESLDPPTHRLYVSHLGAGTIAVYDIPSATVVGEIQGVPGIHGVLAVPDLGRVYATATSTYLTPNPALMQNISFKDLAGTRFTLTRPLAISRSSRPTSRSAR